MALPTNKISKVKLPNNTQYDIIPSMLRDGTTNYKLSVPTLSADSTIALSSQINNGTLTIQKNGTQVATFTANQSGNSTANITVPTTLDDISDGSTRKLANYLPLTGGTLTGNLTVPTIITTGQSGLTLNPSAGTQRISLEDYDGDGGLTFIFTNNNSITGSLKIPYNVSGTLATVATSGSYNDLSNKPAIPTVSDYYWADVKVSASSSKGTTPTFSTVTVGGSGSTAGKATMQYNSTEDCIEFVFA